MTQDNTIEHIQLVWTDLGNITRCRIISHDRFQAILDVGVSVTSSILSLPTMYDAPLELPVGEVRLVPKTKPMLLPWSKNMAIVFCDFYYQGEPWNRCPRSFLVSQQKILQRKEIKPTIGFEIEFVLLDKNGNPIDSTLYCDTKALMGSGWTVLAAIVDTLKVLKVPVWQYHPESAHGQFEISIGPFFDMVHAADCLVLTREAIYNVANGHGLKATLIPKPFENQAGSASHVHLSLADIDGANMFKTDRSAARSFLTGVLNELPAVMSIYAPTIASYDRLQPQSWAGAYKCIGTENKEAAIRLIKGDHDLIERFELKTPDGTANPYLLVGMLIASGLYGIKQNMHLPNEVLVEPSQMPADERPERLPHTLLDSVALFEHEYFTKEVLGKELHGLLVKLRREEYFYYSGLSEAERRAAYLTRY